MEGRLRSLVYVAVVCIVLMAVFYLLFTYYASPDRQAGRASREAARQERALFIATFDSLYHHRLLPTVWRLGVFTKTAFDADFTEWTLTVSATDWYNRSTDSKRDLAATLWAAYRGAREQAGGDPDRARLIIRDNDGNKVAECLPDGLSILR
jgi:hypothetical protein